MIGLIQFTKSVFLAKSLILLSGERPARPRVPKAAPRPRPRRKLCLFGCDFVCDEDGGLSVESGMAGGARNQFQSL